MSIESSREKQAFQAFEHQGWEAISDGYSRQVARVTHQAVPATLDAAQVGSRSRVLDVCTGPGVLAKAACERGAQVTGLDFSARLLDIAARNAPAAAFQEGDAQALPFDDESFDVVVCGFGVMHLPDPAAALSEFRRVLEPGGRCAVSVWQSPAPDNGFGVLLGAIRAHGNLDVSLPHGPDMFQFSSDESMSRALQETGFRHVETTAAFPVWELRDVEGLIEGTLEGAVRSRALLQAQTREDKDAIVEAVASAMAQFESDDGLFHVPMPALIGSGEKQRCPS